MSIPGTRRRARHHHAHEGLLYGRRPDAPLPSEVHMNTMPADTSIRHLQRFHQVLDQEKGFDQDLLRNVALLSGEVGELVRAVQDWRRPDSSRPRQELAARVAEELADILAYVLKLANYASVDLEDAYVRKMQANLARTWRKPDDGPLLSSNSSPAVPD
jgi:NTP pyrophosphatase (non-canonical NTP hydrolase)